MNCLQCQELLQHRLDRQPIEDSPTLEQHLADCPECRLWHGAAQRLEDGLRRLAPPCPPAGLTERIVARVLADRQVTVRSRPRLFAVTAPAAALAASVLLLVLARSFRPTPHAQPAPEQDPALVQPLSPPAPPSLTASVAEAGEALTALTRRTADETVGSTRLLWPVVTAPLPREEPGEMPPPLDPTARSLREAGQGLSTGLEPVTDSARRALGLFLGEIPNREPADRSGL